MQNEIINPKSLQWYFLQFVDSFLKISMYVVLVLMLAASFGLDAASIVAVLGSAGVALGLALKGSLSNFAKRNFCQQ